MKRPRVSVIIPVYNAAQYLRQSIRSVLDQDVAPGTVEIIVVDDGSTDDVRPEIAHFGDAVCYVRQDNRGIASARNHGVALSQGEYLTFLDADDYFLPGRLRKMLGMIGAEPALITTDFYYETAGQRERESRFTLTRSLAFFDMAAQEQYRKSGHSGMFSYMTMLTRQLFDDAGGFDESLRYCEDYDLWLRCMALGVPVRTVKEPLAVYRYLRPGATTTESTAEKLRCRIRVLRKHAHLVESAAVRRLRRRLAYLLVRDVIRRG